MGRRFVYRWVHTLALLMLLAGNLYGLGVLVSTSIVSGASASNDKDLPDCCKNGMCPHHHHSGTQTAVVQLPAIIVNAAPSPFLLSPAGMAPILLIGSSGKPDLRTETPPPKS